MSLFDNLKGIAIILIFFIHSPLQEIANPFIIFLMPIFSFLSGYSLKSGNSESTLKSLSTLYIFIHLLHLIFGLLAIVRNNISFDSIFFSHTTISWYILAVIFWIFVTPLFKSTKFPFLLSLVFSLIICSAWIEIPPNAENRFYLGTFYMVRYYPFFLLGVLVPWKKIIEFRNSKLKYLTIIPLVFFYYVTFTECFGGSKVNCDLTVMYNLIFVSTALFSSAFAIGFAPGRNIKFLTRIGQRSLNIYVLHSFILCMAGLVIRNLIPDFNSTIWVYSYIPGILFMCYIFSTDSFTRIFNNVIQRLKRFIFVS